VTDRSTKSRLSTRIARSTGPNTTDPGAEQQAQVAVPPQQLPGSAEVDLWCERILMVDGLSEGGCSVGVVRTGVRTYWPWRG
jgi:hypothetical protein